MKTFIKKIGFLPLFGLTMLFACSESPEQTIERPPVPEGYTKATAEYYPEMHGKTVGSYSMVFYKDCSYNPVTVQPNGGPGSFIRLELNTNLPPEDPTQEHRMGEGTYRIIPPEQSMDPDTFTFYQGYAEGAQSGGSHYGVINDKDEITISLIKGGEFTLARDGKKYVVTGTFVLENGESVELSYNGDCKIYDWRTNGENPPPFSGTFVTASAAYQGDFHNPNTGMLLLSLLDMTFDQNNNLLVPGYRLALDFNVPLFASQADITLPVGSYTIRVNDEFSDTKVINGGFDNNGNPSGSYWDVYTSYGRENIFLVESGTCEVSKSGDTYTIVTTFRFDNQNITGRYEGPITFFDSSHLSLINADVSLTNLTGGNLNFYGALSYYADDAYNWVIELFTPTGDGVSLDILADDDKAYITELPAGTYNVIEQMSNEYLLPNTFVPGFVLFQTAAVGCWYYENDMAQAPLIEGTITVARDGENYTIAFDLSDDYPYGTSHRVKGSYTGPMVYSDLSEGWLHEEGVKIARSAVHPQAVGYKYAGRR